MLIYKQEELEYLTQHYFSVIIGRNKPYLYHQFEKNVMEHLDAIFFLAKTFTQGAAIVPFIYFHGRFKSHADEAIRFLSFALLIAAIWIAVWHGYVHFKIFSGTLSPLVMVAFWVGLVAGILAVRLYHNILESH